MQKFKYFIILHFFVLFLLSCNDNIKPTVINVGKTHKIESKNNWKSSHDLSYFWSKPQGPDNHKSTWVINDKSILFTPRIPGEYEFSLSVETTTGKILGNEIFHFLAIYENEGNKEITEIEDEPNINISTKKSSIEDEVSYSSGFSVQVSSWNENHKAIEHQQKLIKLGFDDSYVIKKQYDDKTERWRVRIGPYKDINEALQIKNDLKIKGYKSFISSVKFKN